MNVGGFDIHLLGIGVDGDGLHPASDSALEREFDDGLIDLGRYQGIEEEQELLIIKKGRLDLATETVGFAYAEDDVLGSFRVTNRDENVSEGKITTKGFFDLINPEDEVVLAPILPEPEEPSEQPTGLLRRIFGERQDPQGD